LFKLSDEERAIAAKKFEEHDKDKSGTLDKEELRLVLKEKMPKASEKMVDRLLDAQFQLVRRCCNVKVTL
jgi:Ca2+-binding EF-hand superfamily protein